MVKHALILVAAGLALGLASYASAAPTGVSCSAAGCFSNSNGDQNVNDGALEDALDVEFCTTNAQLVNSLTVDTQYLPGAKSLYVENRSSATYYVGFDAQQVTTTGGGATGYKFAPGTERAFSVAGTAFGPRIRIAATAITTTPSCLFLGWLK